MHDAAPGGHPVDLAGPDRHRGAEAVAVHDLAVEQIGHRGEPDMRMRPHVHAGPGAEFHRAEMVEEDERPHHARLRARQRAADFEAAEIDRARHDHMLDRVALEGVAGGGVLRRKEAHGLTFRWLRFSIELACKASPQPSLWRYSTSMVGRIFRGKPVSTPHQVQGGLFPANALNAARCRPSARCRRCSSPAPPRTA